MQLFSDIILEDKLLESTLPLRRKKFMKVKLSILSLLSMYCYVNLRRFPMWSSKAEPW